MTNVSAVSFDEDPFDLLNSLPPTYSRPKAKQDHLSTSIEEATPRYSPGLPPPQANPLYRMFAQNEKETTLGHQKLDTVEKEITTALEEIEKLSQERQALFIKSLEKEKEKASWKGLADIAGVFSLVGSVMFGASIGSNLLIASGIAGGLFKVLDETHFLDSLLKWKIESEEKQASIKQKILSGAYYLQLGLAVAGGLSAWRGGRLPDLSSMGALDAMQKFSGLVTTASSIAQVVCQVGMAYANKLLANHLSMLRLKELEIKERNLKVAHMAKDAQEQTNQEMSKTGVLQRAIHGSVVHPE